ncbi:hypothetical protein AGMMS49938_13040 [Fibrobacterales bacterium]|nr:hypothetical protein AGMMS49938_13040 [Fibrobacterales bacterium]
MKKVLLIALSATMFVSCASKRAGVVNPTILEAETLKNLSAAQGVTNPAVDSLIAEANKQNKDKQTEAAYIYADEAILQLQLARVKQEQAKLADETAKANANLTTLNDSLEIYRSVLDERKTAPKEQVINQ